MVPEKKWSGSRLLPIAMMYAISSVCIILICIMREAEFTFTSGVVSVNILLLSFVIFQIEIVRLKEGYRNEGFYNIKRILFFFTLSCVGLIVMSNLHSYFRPMMLIGILFTLIVSENFGYVVQIYFAAILVLVNQNSIEEFLLYMVCGVIGCIIAKLFLEKTTYQWLVLIVISVYLSLGAVFYYIDTGLFKVEYLIWSLGGAILTLLGGFAMVPYVNKNIIQRLDQELKRINDLKHILLKQYKESLPKEYQHALFTALLAEKSAKRIGANPLLAKVAGLYYGIGKMQKEEFIEENVHIAKENNFPMELTEILYQYRGKIALPSSKESAIVLLADQIAWEYDKLGREGLQSEMNREIIVQQIFNKKTMEGMFEETGLSMKMIMDLKESFVKRGGKS